MKYLMKWIQLLVVIVLGSLVATMADGRLPQIGDSVAIITLDSGLSKIILAGNITDEDDNTICMNCTYAERELPNGSSIEHINDGFGEICLGKSSYLFMQFVDPEDLP